MANVCVNVHGMEGIGNNKTEAKADAIQKLDAAIHGSYSPLIFLWRSLVGIVYRQPSGYSYVIVDGPRENGRYAEHFCAGKEDAVNSVRRHLAQWEWTPEDGYQTVPEILKENPEEDQREHLRWAKWQTRYAEKKAQGGTDEECRRYAGLI